MVAIRADSGRFHVAEIRGVDPRDVAPHAAPLRDALARGGVVCIRMERPLQDHELRAVARAFGPLKDPIGKTRDGELLRYAELRQVIDSGFVVTDEIREKLGDLQFGGLDDERPGLFETFHCDDTFTPEPAGPTLLHARALPPSGGGATIFLDMREAYALLDEAMRRRIEGLRVVYAHNNHDAFPPRRSASGPADLLETVSHPLVRTHARAGSRALFLDLDRATQIAGMELEAGRGLLRELQEHAEARAPRCAHDWHHHDVLVWDNASVQHKARGDFKRGEPRRFWRYMVEGGRPL